jgi:hypothetical protein
MKLPSGMIIRDIPIFSKAGKTWAGNVSRPLVDRDGHVAKEATGKWKWVPVVTFDDPTRRQLFGQKVLEALLQAHPDALPQGEGAP